MKTLFIVLAYAVLIHSSSDWLTDFEQAKQLAKQNQKHILLNFSGSDWCGPCIKMKKDVFTQQEFQEFAEQNLILVRADFPRQKKNQLAPELKVHNEKLAEQYNSKGKFPLTLLLDADGKVIHEWDGYPGTSGSDFIKDVNTRLHGK